jgi:hypothetical protein
LESSNTGCNERVGGNDLHMWKCQAGEGLQVEPGGGAGAAGGGEGDVRGGQTPPRQSPAADVVAHFEFAHLRWSGGGPEGVRRGSGGVT